MIALILNSGIGSRMRGLLGVNPKCLINIHEGVPLLGHQIEIIRKSGIRNIIITTGYKSHEITSYVSDNYQKIEFIKFIHNPYFAITNYIYSIFLCLSHLMDDIILVHGDLFFSESVFSNILNQDASTVAVDTTTLLNEKDFKAKIKDGQIIEISTMLKGEDCNNCQPLYKLYQKDWGPWAEMIKYFCEHNKRKAYAEEALNLVLNEINLFPFDLKGDLCMEIDTPEDLRMLKERI